MEIKRPGTVLLFLISLLPLVGALIVFGIYIHHTEIIDIGSEFTKSNSTWTAFASVYAYLLSPIVGLLGFIGIIITILSQDKTSNKELTYSYLVELIKLYCGIRKEISINGKSGVSAFSILLSELYRVHKLIRSSELASEISDHEIIGISFVFFYFGPNEKAKSFYTNLPKTKEISDLVASQQFKDEDGKIHKRHKGHQAELGHYFRFLYNAFDFIQKSNYISKQEKKNLGKLLRSSISNYELGLLALNCQSKLGYSWIETGKVKDFNLFKNIPQYFFVKEGMGFTIEELYPDIDYEWK